jgi:hypothetical protein
MKISNPTTLNSVFLGSMRIEVEESIELGDTQSGWRRFDRLKGGVFEGPRIKARILPGGSDIILRHADGSLHPDVRLAMQTDDGDLVLITYRGIRVASDAVSARLAAGEHVPWNADGYYLRNAPFFQTASKKYDWLNRILAVGVGRREGPMVAYEVFEVR